MSNKYDWIYDRVKLSSKFNPYLIIDLSVKKPEKFPIYVRARDTRVPYLEQANSLEELPTADGYVAQKIVHGDKVYYDYTIFQSKIVEKKAFLEEDGDLNPIASNSGTLDMAAKVFGLENGKIHFETIAGVIFRVSISEFE